MTSSHSILDRYDGLLVDLDGTVFAGGKLIDGAKEGLEGRLVSYVTNNASRSPADVAQRLWDLGIDAEPNQVLTSAQAACLLAMNEVVERDGVHNPPSAYVIGTESFRDLAREAGFQVVDSAYAEPDVVLQGHDPHNTWEKLSEGALAIRRGALFVASNLDTSLPSERGLLVGNGSMVAAVQTATGVRPLSSGKPGPEMFRAAADRLGAQQPLVIGDRLDTDIAGGIAAGFDTMCVLTGVSTHHDVLDTTHRPTHIAGSLSATLCGWNAEVSGGEILVSSGEEGDLSVMAAEAVAVVAPLYWEIRDATPERHIRITPKDAIAREAIEAWR